MTSTLADVAQTCHAQVVGTATTKVTDIVTDSRKPFVASRSLFVALRGDRHNGAQYIADLYRRGMRAFVVERTFDTTPYPLATFLLVDETLAALQQIAAVHRMQSHAKVVAVCGSNGKTIVKEWLSQLIDNDLRTVRSPRSYNSQVGVPLSVLKIESETQLAIIEAGISQMGEMAKLESIVRPTDVIFTNLGQAHQENFPSYEVKAAEKATMGRRAQRIFFCQDQPDLGPIIAQNCPESQQVSWGAKAKTDSPTEYRVTSAETNDLLNITVTHMGQTFAFQSTLTDAMSAENISHAIVYALTIGIGAERIAERVKKLGPIGMRMEQKMGHNGCTIIDDAYNADITSLEVALDMLHVMGNRRSLTRTLILSDLQQTGLPDGMLYGRVARLLDEKGVDRLIGIGRHIAANMAGRHGATFFQTTEEFLSKMSTADFCNEAILVKGQRNFGFERISVMLECLRNRTAMEINLSALAHNIAYFRSFLKPETKLLAMVKAYSYGTGSFEIAKVMQQQGVDYLGVAFADEGYDLRQAGITLPIAVMNPEVHSFDLMIKNELEPQIYCMEELEAYSEAVRRAGVERGNVHIKINTGMNRSGFNPTQVTEVVEALKRYENLHVVSAFSHLVESEDSTKDEGTERQIADFEAACEALKQGIGYGFIRHILNSAGIERFSAHQMEMVRLGIGLYGVSAIDNSRLRNVATLKSYVSMVRKAKAGETVGYNRRTVLTRDSLIAIVPIGYADGVDRRLSNGVGRVLINGHMAPVAGNVCMDITMVDVTDVPNVKGGDTVELFGDTEPVWEMSARIGTIPYEILTGIGRRVKRIYFVE